MNRALPFLFVLAVAPDAVASVAPGMHRLTCAEVYGTGTVTVDGKTCPKRPTPLYRPTHNSLPDTAMVVRDERGNLPDPSTDPREAYKHYNMLLTSPPHSTSSAFCVHTPHRNHCAVGKMIATEVSPACSIEDLAGAATVTNCDFIGKPVWIELLK